MAVDLAARYEQLRSDALSCSAGRGQGLVLFLRQGMLAWMRAWSGCSVSPEPRSSPPPRTDSILPPDVRGQMTTVLAAMILERQQEVFL